MTADEILYSPLINEARDVLADIRENQRTPFPNEDTLWEYDVLRCSLIKLYSKMSEREVSDMELIHIQHLQLSPWGSS